MTDLTKLQEDADEAGRKFILESGEPELIIEIAMFLTFEFEQHDGEGQGAAEHRCVLEAKRRWRIGDQTDLIPRRS